jgi:hypothetical protein
MYQYKDAVDRGTFYQPRCLSHIVPGKSWAGALITDEDPEDRWHKAVHAFHDTLAEVLRDLEQGRNVRWTRETR